jgi:hypothetical protein
VFDADFFREVLPERAREYAEERGLDAIRVEVTTLLGQRLRVKSFTYPSNNQPLQGAKYVGGWDGVRMVTEEDELIFLPFTGIASIKVVPATGGGGFIGFGAPAEASAQSAE